jgi:hypothetical protein
MGHRTRKIVAVALAALAVTTACGDGGGSAGGGTGDADKPKAISSADEVIKVVDKGFLTYRFVKPGIESDYVSYGYVIENVTDEVALTVRVKVEFTDAAGDPIPDLTAGGSEFSVVLPGRQMGAGRTEQYAGHAPGGVRPTIAGMNVKITMITALDTPDGKRFRKPPAPYAELKTGDPVAGKRSSRAESVAVEVTNTYDVPLKPKVTAVVRDADGVIVGGMDGVGGGKPMAELQPGDSAKATFSDRPIAEPRLTSGTIECYADPNLGRMITRDIVWHEI